MPTQKYILPGMPNGLDCLGPSVCYLSNGRVAWPMNGEISRMYKDGYYLPSEGWEVITRLKGKWKLDVHKGCYVKEGALLMAHE